MQLFLQLKVSDIFIPAIHFYYFYTILAQFFGAIMFLWYLYIFCVGNRSYAFFKSIITPFHYVFFLYFSISSLNTVITLHFLILCPYFNILFLFWDSLSLFSSKIFSYTFKVQNRRFIIRMSTHSCQFHFSLNIAIMTIS